MPQQPIPNHDADHLFPPLREPVEKYFPLKTPEPAPHTFEIGLVLGGTVSAAAYTAGVIDFLVEALDAWTLAKESNDPSIPRHNVVIKILAGTSGGGITSVLLSRILGFAFPHCDIATPPQKRIDNPLYDIWVNQIDIDDLLKTDDLDNAKEISSLLCPNKLDAVCERMAAYSGPSLGANQTPSVRSYFEQPLPVVLTLTNLRGVPYSSHFRGNSKRPEYYTDHADHIRFRVDIVGSDPPTDLEPYEIGISATAAPDVEPWETIIHAARGTSAFPLGFPPQTISRDPRHYLYRYMVLDGVSPPSAVWLRPAWSCMISAGATEETPYEFLCVDGGCFNNEPTEYARQWLAGIAGHNDRDATLAHRAVVLVDPFADAPDFGLVSNPGVLGTAIGTLSSLTSGTRFETADLDLFTSEEIFSRFLINPVRQDKKGNIFTGGDAIATSSLQAFGGFLSPAFREHDFFLGRRNCQQFLRNSFMLDEYNSLFDDWPNKESSVMDGFLPIIPLVSGVDKQLKAPEWPIGAFDPESIRQPVEQRLKKLGGLSTELAGGGWLTSLLAKAILLGIDGPATDKIISAITVGLRKANLLD